MKRRLPVIIGMMILITGFMTVSCTQTKEAQNMVTDTSATPMKTPENIVSVNTTPQEPSDNNFVDYLKNRLPVGTHRASRLTVGFSDEAKQARLRDLSAKISQGMLKNKDFFEEYMSKYGGETLPYTEKLGVSEHEYNEYLSLIEGVGTVPVYSLLVEVTQTDSGIKLTSGNDQLGFREIEIDFTTKEISVASKTIPYKEIMKKNNDQKATGPHSGFVWDYASRQDQVSISQLENGKTLLYLSKDSILYEIE